jgi:hypothetical protein
MVGAMTERFAKIPLRAASVVTLSASDWRVFVVIAAHANGAGRANPSLQLIASLAHIERRNVSRAITRLEIAGRLRRRRRKRGPGLWDRSSYEVVFDGPSEPAEQTIAPAQKPEDWAVAEKMMAIWQTECDDRLPLPRKLDQGRVNACRARYSDAFGRDLDQWRAYCRTIMQTPFLCGEGNRGWKADFDWALKPQSVRNLREGRYQDSKVPRRSSRRTGTDYNEWDQYAPMPPLGPGGT